MTEFIRGARTAERMTLTPAARNTASKRGGEAGVPVMQQELHPRPGVLQVHEQVPGLLHHPGLDRMLGGAKNPYAAGAAFDHGKDVDLGAVERVGGEEVQRQGCPVPGTAEIPASQGRPGAVPGRSPRS
jgi:hypothetical protein